MARDIQGSHKAVSLGQFHFHRRATAKFSADDDDCVDSECLEEDFVPYLFFLFLFDIFFLFNSRRHAIWGGDVKGSI